MIRMWPIMSDHIVTRSCDQFEPVTRHLWPGLKLWPVELSCNNKPKKWFDGQGCGQLCVTMLWPCLVTSLEVWPGASYQFKSCDQVPKINYISNNLAFYMDRVYHCKWAIQICRHQFIFPKTNLERWDFGPLYLCAAQEWTVCPSILRYSSLQICLALCKPATKCHRKGLIGWPVGIFIMSRGGIIRYYVK